MRAIIAFSVIALVQGACGFVFSGQTPATPVGVFRRVDSESLSKRQEVCDAVSGLSCRTGEYCVVIDGSVGCCPEGIRTCVDHDTSGCEKGGTVHGALCCDANVPYCNTIGNTQFCDSVKQEIITQTITSTVTICPHSNATAAVTRSCPSSPASNTTTTTYALPTLTPYPSENGAKVTFTSTEMPTTLVVAETSSYNISSANVTPTIPIPSKPAMEGRAVASNASFSVVLGGIVVAFMGILLG
ncbi:hypothetical protein BGX38DRAFT_1139247 [Terfezia claveryi]|nr:hypothetical protein BGX38DRAFT_1139247 [Terfezia claveryi]